MTRLLLVSDIFPPDIGGPASFIPALGSALVHLGHAITGVCRTPRASPADDAGWPFPVRRRPGTGMAAGLRLMATLAQEAARHSVIFTNGLERQVELVCRALGRPYVLKVVGDLAWERMRLNGLTRQSIDEFQLAPPASLPGRAWVQRRLSFARHARRVIVPSRYLRQLVIGWGVAPERVVVIRNGVEAPAAPGLTPRRRTEARLDALYVGRLVNWKGLETTLRAVAGTAAVHLTIVGQGPEAAGLQALAAELGLAERVVFRGGLSRAATQAALRAADVLVLCSEYEGLSHTLLEAGAAGLPCLTSERGGNPEVIESGRNGLIVPYGDVDALRAGLQRLQADEPERLRLAEGALAASRAFDFAQTVAQTAALFAEPA